MRSPSASAERTGRCWRRSRPRCSTTAPAASGSARAAAGRCSARRPRCRATCTRSSQLQWSERETV
eukprot:12574317-Alexandrium_andersonii.AAC.1